ncbi:SUKH-4 family immunity protein [Rhodococcus sp. (in: high G+C Gram-positive bacteria)]|uniref:SUKH-4 family immunity protein n=1 Tax=Rhodococcus sp. TaxID=1831 RepID=UPI003B8A8FF6
MTISPLLAGLCDDAALFPPGNAPMDAAVPAHLEHERSDHAALVGPFVFPAPRLGELPAIIAKQDGDLELSLTVPAGTDAVPAALEQLRAIDGVRLVAMEIGVPEGQAPDALFAALGEISSAATGVEIFVEVPRDDRRPAILAAMAGTPYSAKFRTGGIVAAAYPDEAELAAAIHTVATSGVRFKATAGLHHAIRNTDPETGFEQHGFLNVMLATHRATGGASVEEVAATLADRDGTALAGALAGLSAEAVDALRANFRSFGTCSISDPLTELVGLGLVPRSSTEPSAPTGSVDSPSTEEGPLA